MQEERRSFGDKLLGSCGFVDAFRAAHPGVAGYTYWDHKTRARERNAGWRLDYCLARACSRPQHPVLLVFLFGRLPGQRRGFIIARP